MKRVRSNWGRALLVCGKCSRKLGGGFGRKGRTPLAKALRRELGVGKGRKATLGVVEVKCLGLCSKRGVTLIDTADLRRWRIVPSGTPVDALAAELSAGTPPNGPVSLEVAETVVVIETAQPPA